MIQPQRGCVRWRNPFRVDDARHLLTQGWSNATTPRGLPARGPRFLGSET